MDGISETQAEFCSRQIPSTYIRVSEQFLGYVQEERYILGYIQDERHVRTGVVTATHLNLNLNLKTGKIAPLPAM